MNDYTPVPQPNAPQPNAPQPKRLTRTANDKMLAGVCGGFARYANLDATLVRVLAVLGLVAGFGSLGILYLVAWAVMPEE